MEELIKEEKYDELFDDDSLEFMQNKVKRINMADFKTMQEYHKYLDTLPPRISHHPLLLDYDWVYQNIESIFFEHRLNYQQFQDFEEYYFFFKVLTKKYSLEQDYQDYLDDKNNFFNLKFKWQSFAFKLAEFFSMASQDILEKLFLQEDFRDYFVRYADLFNKELMVENFPSFLLKYYPFRNFYENNPAALLELLDKNPQVVLPIDMFLNPLLIKTISHNIDTDKFYYNLQILGNHYANTPYLDEHQKFITEQIEGIKNGILPALQNSFQESNDYCYDNNDKYDNKIFAGMEDLPMPKLEYYQKLSKYYLIELVISALFEVTYYNLLVDMETLVIFGKEHQKEIKGLSYYEFLINIEDKSFEDIIRFYQKAKNLNLKEMFYDDWNKQKEDLIQELNANILDPKTLEIKFINGIPYYDITNFDKYLIIHAELSARIYDANFLEYLESLKEKMLLAKRVCISLSIQDKDHQGSYAGFTDAFITFIYGPLDPRRVGTVYYEDAYTQGLQDVEFESDDFIRRIYTLEDLMRETNDFNELVYAINGTPFYPIGILVNEISPLIQKASTILELPIFYRETNRIKENKVKKYNPERIRSRYNNLNRYLHI